MIISLGNDERITLDVFFNDIPRRICAICQSANTQALALTDGVVHQSLVLPQRLSIYIFDDARLCGQILLKKICEASFADKTDSC